MASESEKKQPAKIISKVVDDRHYASVADVVKDSRSVKGKPMKIVIMLPTSAYFVSGIRDFTLGLIQNTTHFSEQWAYRFQSVVDELCNNAIEYGSAPNTDIRLTFTLVEGESVQIDVEDTGTGSKPIDAKSLNDLVMKRRAVDYVFKGIRGRGLPKIVAEWTDELSFEDRGGGGIKVTVKKFLKQDEVVKPMKLDEIKIHSVKS